MRTSMHTYSGGPWFPLPHTSSEHTPAGVGHVRGFWCKLPAVDCPVKTVRALWHSGVQWPEMPSGWLQSACV